MGKYVFNDRIMRPFLHLKKGFPLFNDFDQEEYFPSVFRISVF